MNTPFILMNLKESLKFRVKSFKVTLDSDLAFPSFWKSDQSSEA